MLGWVGDDGRGVVGGVCRSVGRGVDGGLKGVAVVGSRRGWKGGGKGGWSGEEVGTRRDRLMKGCIARWVKTWVD